MKNPLKILFILALAGSACHNADVSRYVDPNIGGVTPLLTTKNPTVHRPHSMIRVFPVTKPGLDDRYLSDRIYGFAVNMPAYRMGYVSELMPTFSRCQRFERDVCCRERTFISHPLSLRPCRTAMENPAKDPRNHGYVVRRSSVGYSRR
jgi:hypothetical protein